jgi:glutamyl-tRNA synthetase
MPVGRYAPSPSGPLHLGNLRTALLAWLFARSVGARFLLRIEDLDEGRSRPEHERSQLADLRALGLDWDGQPVRQSERTQLYLEAFQALRDQGRVYPCWCTRADIRNAVRAPHGHPEDGYPGTCRRLGPGERAEKERQARRPASWRLDAGAEVVGFDDRLHGRVERSVDDLLLRRWDGAFAYNLAVVVDDADQGVGEVVRGDDLLEWTPRQLLLARLLGHAPPAYAHVPLVMGPDGKRLSKRHGSVTLRDRAALGESPALVLSWMAASVGLAEPGEEVSAGELVDRFDPALLPREPTVLDTTARG